MISLSNFFLHLSQELECIRAKTRRECRNEETGLKGVKNESSTWAFVKEVDEILVVSQRG